MTENKEILYQLDGINKSFKLGRTKIPVLNNLNFSIKKSKWTSITGPSGCGKTTLLHLLGGLDKPSSGKIFLEEQDITTLSSGKLSQIRKKRIGYIFQSYQLFPELTAIENALLPALRFDVDKKAAEERARELLSSFGLAKRLQHRPRELSGGEQQRVAIARALINNPQIILADEPTGNLDAEASKEILRILLALLEKQEISIIMVTHDLQLAQKSDFVIKL